MNIRNHRICCRDKQNLKIRLERKRYEDQTDVMFKGTNIHYEIADRTRTIKNHYDIERGAACRRVIGRFRAIGFGGIGAMHPLVSRLGLDRTINKNLELLKSHVPYLLRIGSRIEHRLRRVDRRDVP